MHPAFILALALAAGCAIAIYQQRLALGSGGGAAAPGDALGEAGEGAAADEGNIPAVAFAAGASAAAELFGSEPVTTFSLPTANAPYLNFTMPARGLPYAEAIRQAEIANGIPTNLLARQLQQESDFNPNAVNKFSGATGIGQFMPATARDLNLDPRDPFASIDSAGKYMGQLYTATGSWISALAAYNWGIGNVLRKGLDRAPSETVNYVRKIAGVDIKLTEQGA